MTQYGAQLRHFHIGRAGLDGFQPQLAIMDQVLCVESFDSHTPKLKLIVGQVVEHVVHVAAFRDWTPRFSSVLLISTHDLSDRHFCWCARWNSPFRRPSAQPPLSSRTSCWW